MRILLNDRMQEMLSSDMSSVNNIKSPALSQPLQIGALAGEVVIEWPYKIQADSIGIGGTDLPLSVQIDNDGIWRKIDFNGSGLYIFSKEPLFFQKITIRSLSNFIDRIAVGRSIYIGTDVNKEITYKSSIKSKITLGGQIMPSYGGYMYRELRLKSNYKITQEIHNEIRDGYKWIGQGYPVFLDLSEEEYKLGFNKFYGYENSNAALKLKSAPLKYLWTMDFNFVEAF